MPAIPPVLTPPAAAQLTRLGTRLRDERKRQRISAQAAAEAAGMSRVTLHRIERGEAAVTIGAWLGAAAVLGLQLELVNPAAAPAASNLPARIRLGDYPQLKKLAWQLHGVEELAPEEALALYERNWRHVDRKALSPGELALIESLSSQLGGGRLLV
jgi:transcriptional regulator with XRE-family HTH domain